MKFLINIGSDSELITYEAVALGFVLASFDHTVQFLFTDHSLNVLQDPTSRVYGMVQSLELYDIDVAWVDFSVDKLASLDSSIKPMIIATPDYQATDFDTVLTF